MDELKQVLQYQYKDLPEDLQKVVGSENWKNILKTLGGKYNLSSEDSESLNVETMLVLFGLESYRDFEQNLSNEGFSLSRNVLQAVADEVYSSVFKPVQTYLDEVDRKEEESNPVMANGEMINKTQVLHDIENPQKVAPVFEKFPSVPAGANIIDDKLNKIVKLPREEKYMNNGEQKSVGQTQPDPYREPIE